MKIDNVTGAGVPGDPLVAPPASIEDAVDQFVNPDVDAPTKAAAAALGQKVRTKSGPAPADVTVVVLNGNGVRGGGVERERTARRTATTTRCCRRTGLEANAPTQDYFRTTVLYRTSLKGAKAAAQQVANLFAPADVKPMPLDEQPPSKMIRHLSNGADARRDRRARRTRATWRRRRRTGTPRTTAPNVVTNPDVALAALRRARSRPVPAAGADRDRAVSSVLDSEQPVRVYKISGNHKAVRLTFRTGAFGYWGVEETDWTEAPVFSASNQHAADEGPRLRALLLGLAPAHGRAARSATGRTGS